jgi:hypothetical protein
LIAVGGRLPPARAQRLSLLAAAAVFTVVIAGTLAVDLVAPVPAVRVFGEEDRRERALRASARFADGSLAAVLERDLRQRSRVRRWVVDRWARVLYRNLRWVKPPVACGPDGWLFLEERIAVGGQKPERDVLWSGAVLSALDRRLTAFGHRLLLMPVPRKAALAARHLPAGYDARPGLDDRAIDELERRGLEVVDLRPGLRALGGRAYHMLGSHWTDEAQLAAARAAVEALGLPAETGDALFRRRPGAATVDTDLLNMVGVIGSYNPPEAAARDSVVATNNRAVADGEGRPEADELVVLGSSFSHRRRITGYLEAMLGTTVWNGARGGRPPDGVIADFVDLRTASPAILLETPLHHFLNRAHERFAVDTMTRRAPERLLRLRAASPAERRIELGEEWAAEAHRPVLVLPERRVAHTGDGAFGLRLRGRVQAPVKVTVTGEGLGRVRYVWRPPVDAVVLPLLDLRPTTRRTEVAIAPLGNAAVGVRLDAVELVSEVAPEPHAELGRESVTDLDGSWRAVVPVRSETTLARDAALILRLAVEGGDFDRQLQVAVYPSGDADPLVLRYRDLGRGTLVVSSLRPLAGQAVDRVELRGSGNAPDRVLDRSTLRFGGAAADPPDS